MKKDPFLTNLGSALTAILVGVASVGVYVLFFQPSQKEETIRVEIPVFEKKDECVKNGGTFRVGPTYYCKKADGSFDYSKDGCYEMRCDLPEVQLYNYQF